MCGIAILLFTVAFLQYRWNNQIKQATEVRMGSELESVMMKWQLDLYGEFSTICVALQVGPDSGARDSWEDYLERYYDWVRASKNVHSVENIYTNRDLVKEIYIWKTSLQRNPQLLRLDADFGEIKEAAVPDDLRTLLAHLQGHSSDLRTALRAWEPNSPPLGDQENEDDRSRDNRLRSNAITGWQFDENIPAIVHPILQRKPRSSRQEVTNLEAVDWMVIVLNFDTIRNRIFPQLTRRYFAGGQGLDYKLAVVTAGKGGNLLYSSDPGFGIPEVSGFDRSLSTRITKNSKPM